MISKQNYELLKEKYGHVSSWTIWKAAGSSPKSNTDNMSWIHDANLLSKINTGYVFVGLNASSTHGEQNGHWSIPWSGFHSGYTYQNDYKLRYALQGTKYWGSYITDIIKHYPEVDSGKVKTYLRHHPDVIRKNVSEFEEEISLLGGNPVLIALGGDVYKLLKEYLGNKHVVVQIMHFSYTIGKEDYRREVLRVLDKTSNDQKYLNRTSSSRNKHITSNVISKAADEKPESNRSDSFPLNCLVFHTSLGKGTVIKRDSGKAIVLFDQGRIEELNISFCLENKLLKRL